MRITDIKPQKRRAQRDSVYVDGSYAFGLDRESTVKLAPGTQPGKSYRLRGLGAPKANGYGRGDEVVYVHVQVPTDLTEKQKVLLEELSRELSNGDGVGHARGFKEKFKEFFDRQ